MSALAVDGLTKYYGDVRGVEDLSFSVREGEVFGFLGPNGAGKTTTIRTLMGFLRPTSGTATVLGRDVRDEAELIEAKRDVGFLPAEPAFDESVTGRRILDYHARLKGDDRRSELLASFEPPLDRPVGEYSRGNEQKLAIVAAFMHDPDLLVMDEPTSGLDPLLQDRFHGFVRGEREAGKTAFFSSHVLSEVRKVCDRVGILRDGRLVTLESIGEILSRSGKRVRVQVAEDVGPAAFEMPGAHGVSGGEVISFTFTGEYGTLLDRLREYTVLDLDVEEAPLEEVFARFYGNGGDPTGRDGADEGNPDTQGRGGTDPEGDRP
ncbi:ABC transporter [Halobacteriales archaeon QS_8_69_26]|nr:MAG: ABC transporter [Halobacteriales archaeon QS_8_69_26]